MEGKGNNYEEDGSKYNVCLFVCLFVLITYFDSHYIKIQFPLWINTNNTILVCLIGCCF